jgi:hypothetical protein
MYILRFAPDGHLRAKYRLTLLAFVQLSVRPLFRVRCVRYERAVDPAAKFPTDTRARAEASHACDVRPRRSGELRFPSAHTQPVAHFCLSYPS